jgi:hypothetical protein
MRMVRDVAAFLAEGAVPGRSMTRVLVGHDRPKWLDDLIAGGAGDA